MIELNIIKDVFELKKLFFVINNIAMGGIQKSLVELLNVLKDKYDITLYCIKYGGRCIDLIPDNINIIYGSRTAAVSEQNLAEAKKSGVWPFLLRVVLSSFTKVFGKRFPAFLLTKLIGKIPGEYDAAISFSQPIHDKQFATLTNEIVLNCCNAKRKITFVHCDFIKYGGNTKYNRSLYNRFDAIAAVSDSVGQRFLEANPLLKDKVFTVYNCVDCDRIITLANNDPIEYNKKAIVTVARLSEEKGIIRCLPVVSKLVNEGLDLEWHIVGGGPLDSKICDEINLLGLSDRVILHGEQINPYRFMKNADCFLLPSFHEAAPMVFFESAVLDLPVLTTDTLSAYELVENMGAGLVCKNDEESIYSMLHSFLCSNSPFSNITKPDKQLTISQFEKIIKG